MVVALPMFLLKPLKKTLYAKRLNPMMERLKTRFKSTA
jgi:hypothetical protein